MIKDLVNYLLNINIPVKQNATKKRLFDFTAEAIKYYWPVKLRH